MAGVPAAADRDVCSDHAKALLVDQRTGEQLEMTLEEFVAGGGVLSALRDEAESLFDDQLVILIDEHSRRH